MKHRSFMTALMLVLTANAVGQRSAQIEKFVLCQADKGCSALGGQTETKSVMATETSLKKSIYQVFWSRSTPKQELFRVKVGTLVDQEPVKWWVYGIADEADFNGDGLPDYVWYGGDDTSFELYLFLSSGTRYERMDVLRTVQAGWQRRFHKAAPDFAMSEEYSLGKTVLERSAAALVLSVTVEHKRIDGVPKRTFRFRIDQADFKR